MRHPYGLTAIAALFTCAATANGQIQNGGFDWHNTCPWEGERADSPAVAPKIVRNGGGPSGSCSYLQLVADDDTRAGRMSQTVAISASNNDWIRLTFLAYVEGSDADTQALAAVNGGSGGKHRVRLLDTDEAWKPFILGYQVSGSQSSVDIVFEVKSGDSDDLVFLIDNVALAVVGAEPDICEDPDPNDCPPGGGCCTSVGPSFVEPDGPGLDEDSQCCEGDIDGDSVVGFSDVLRVLGAWTGMSTTCAAEDVTADDRVDYPDILLILANWGACEGDEPDSFEDELDCMGMTLAEYEATFEDCLEDGSSLNDENCICWFEHYSEVHCEGTCLCSPNCPGADPLGGH